MRIDAGSADDAFAAVGVHVSDVALVSDAATMQHLVGRLTRIRAARLSRTASRISSPPYR